jgi:hypothetical protein
MFRRSGAAFLNATISLRDRIPGGTRDEGCRRAWWK